MRTCWSWVNLTDDRYTWNEVLSVTRLYWTIREKGNGSTFASARMMDVSKAYDQLDVSERTQLFLGVWLERQEVPSAVIAKMTHYLNGES